MRKPTTGQWKHIAIMTALYIAAIVVWGVYITINGG